MINCEWKRKAKERTKRFVKSCRSIEEIKVLKRIKKADKESIMELCYLNNDFCRVKATRTIAMSDNNSNSHSEALNTRSTRKP